MATTNQSLGAHALEMAGEATLAIPPKYVAWMRYAALKELEEEGKSLSKEAARTLSELEQEAFSARHGGETHDLAWRMSDLNGTRRHVQEAIDATTQLCEGDPEEITGTASALAYALDAFSRQVITGELRNHYGPLEDGDPSNRLAPFVAALEWAGAEEARLRALDAAEREEAKS